MTSSLLTANRTMSSGVSKWPNWPTIPTRIMLWMVSLRPNNINWKSTRRGSIETKLTGQNTMLISFSWYRFNGWHGSGSETTDDGVFPWHHRVGCRFSLLSDIAARRQGIPRASQARCFNSLTYAIVTKQAITKSNFHWVTSWIICLICLKFF